MKLNTLFVWILWALMVLAALTYVAERTDPIPLGEDWEPLPVVVGHRAVSAAWMWELDYEWREPIPRLAIVALIRLSGFDFRAPRFCSVLLLGLAAFALIRAAGQLRGFTRVTDAFFPLVLLHWGQSRPLLQIMFLDYVLTIALAVGVLLVMLKHPGGPPLRAGLLAALCLLGLPLCGAVGVAVAPPLILWLGYAGVRRLRSSEPGGRRDGAWLLSLAALAVGLLGLYFAGYRWPPEAPRAPSLVAALTTAAQFLGMSIGPFGQAGWPYSAFGVILLSLAGAAALLAVWRERPQERVRTAGLLLFVVSCWLLALSVGIGRSGFGEEIGFMDRYITSSTLILCVLYLIWDMAGTPRTGRVIQFFLFGLMLALLPYNARIGLGKRNTLALREKALMKDVRAGLTPKEVAARHWHYFYRSEGKFSRFLDMMRQAQIGPYRKEG